jgi:hypothetical protein
MAGRTVAFVLLLVVVLGTECQGSNTRTRRRRRTTRNGEATGEVDPVPT